MVILPLINVLICCCSSLSVKMNVSQCFIVVFLSFWTCASAIDSPERQTISANGRFANTMYKILSREDGNVVFSPISAHTCLSMLYQCVSGPLQEDFFKVLKVSEPSALADGYQSVMDTLSASGNVTVLIANKIYIPASASLNPSFRSLVEETFSAEVEGLNFTNTEKAAEIINTWVKNKTRGKIPKLFGPDELEDTVLALANTIYFNGSWEKEFDKRHTNAEPFFTDNHEKIIVPMMHTTNTFYHTHRDDMNARILELKYVNSEYSMIIVLPNHKNGLAKVEAKLLERDLSQITRGAELKYVQLSMPKFKFEDRIDLHPLLTEVGLGSIFKPSTHFDGLVEGTSDMFVSQAVQRVFVMVDETGSEAAAATAIRTRARSRTKSRMAPMEFKVDHSFIFLICHHRDGNTGARNVLFYGRIHKPLSYSQL